MWTNSQGEKEMSEPLKNSKVYYEIESFDDGTLQIGCDIDDSESTQFYVEETNTMKRFLEVENVV